MAEVASDDDVYEVESIVDSVVVGGKMYYLVRWKNYGKEGDTWEPKQNLLSCEDLLNNYNRVQAEKTAGLSLPSDVFTAGDSGSETDKPQKDHKEMKLKKAEKKNSAKPKKSKPDQGKVKKLRKPTKSSSSSSDSDSDGPPPLKDNFWEQLEEGKIDVFATDLYSKVKSRRPPEKEVDTKAKTAQEMSGKSKKSGSKKKPEKSDIKPSASEVKVKQPKVKKSATEKTKGHKEDSIKSESKEKIDEKTRKQSIDLEESPSPITLDENDGSPHAVLQYLEGEIKSKSHGKVKSGRKSSRPNKESTIKKVTGDTAVEIDGKGIISQPDVVLEKLDFNYSPASECIDIDVSETDIETDPNENISTKKIEEPILSEEKEIDQPVIMEQDEIIDANLISADVNLTSSEPANNETVKSVYQKTVEPAKPSGVFEAMDAFSAHLRQSDLAASERMIQKKVKAKKSRVSRSTPPIPDKEKEKLKASRSTPPIQDKEKEKSKPSKLTLPVQDIEKFVHEREKSQTLTSASPSTLTDVNETDKPQTALPTHQEPQQDCIPEMLEFLKIHVTFNLDPITPKEIERHHEIGEPHCRLDKDITNAEFRQHIRSNNFEIVYEALKSKTMMYNLEHTDSVWMTQLMVAAAAGYDEIVKILSHHGAKVNARTKNGNTALMFAAEKGHDIVCRILIVYGAYVNLQTTSGETALMKAAKNGYTMIVRYLLQAGADPIVKSAHGTTALELAERCSHSLLSGLIKDHETNLTAHVNECIHRECHSLGIKTIGLPILAPRSYNIRECPLIHVAFNSVLHNVPPNQGLVLFAVHGMITSGLSIKCRMRGPCHVMAVTMNNFVMEPLMPGKTSSEENTHYMTNLIWKNGQNSVKLFMAQDPLSSEKVFVSIFQCSLIA